MAGWWAEFNPQVGREQAGLLPAIVVGTRFACTFPDRLVVAVPGTTINRLRSRRRSTLADDEINAIRTALRHVIDS